MYKINNYHKVGYHKKLIIDFKRCLLHTATAP